MPRNRPPQQCVVLGEASKHTPASAIAIPDGRGAATCLGVSPDGRVAITAFVDRAGAQEDTGFYSCCFEPHKAALYGPAPDVEPDDGDGYRELYNARAMPLADARLAVCSRGRSALDSRTFFVAIAGRTGANLGQSTAVRWSACGPVPRRSWMAGGASVMKFALKRIPGSGGCAALPRALLWWPHRWLAPAALIMMMTLLSHLRCEAARCTCSE